ncbi:MAG TPA: nucleotidyltransferase family protein, partial [Thermoanaerobaculia bacterium]
LDLFGVDLHRGASYLDDRSFADVHARALILPIGSATMRVFAAEDQLRLVCIHALAEGMIRPPWLCDIAMLVQSADATFDWEWFRSGDPRRTEYALAALGLAQQLLGVPIPIDVPPTPRWLARAVLRVWGSGPLAKGSRMTFADARKGGRTVRALIDRWPNPIEATIGMNSAINAMPRLPYQLAEVVRRMRAFVSR